MADSKNGINDLKESKANTLLDLKTKILTEDPTSWSTTLLKKSLSQIKLSTSGTKSELAKRVCWLKNEPSVLDKLLEKNAKQYHFKSSLPKGNIPRPEAPWTDDSSQYPKVSESDIKKYQSLKGQGSKGQYRKALRMFNSRRVRTVKVLKDERLFVKANILKSFGSVTRPAVIMFNSGKPSQGHCECAVGLSGLCCHIICLLMYLEHFTKHGEKFLSLTCTQRLQRWHIRGRASKKTTQLCHLPLSYIRNIRSSRNHLKSTRLKKKVKRLVQNKTNSVDIERSDWMKRDVHEMMSLISTGVQESSVSVENHVYVTLKKYNINSGLHSHLHYNHHYRLKSALEHHDYLDTKLYKDSPLKMKHPTCQETWHAPLVCASTEKDLIVRLNEEIESTCTGDSDSKPMYEQIEVKAKVEKMRKNIEDAKPLNANSIEELCFSIPEWEALKPSGYNYHEVEQCSKEWYELRIGRVTCSQIGNIIGLAGQTEQKHIQTCVINKIDPSKVKPKKFRNFTRGKTFENEARNAFEKEAHTPINTCGFFAHPSDSNYGGSPDGIGPAFLLEIKTRAEGSTEPLLSITADHLLQTNFQMEITGAEITFLQSYLPEKQCSNIFLIERNNLLIDVVKTLVDAMITNTVISSWPHEESKLLQKIGQANMGKVPSFVSLKPLRTWVKLEAKKAPRVKFQCSSL